MACLDELIELPVVLADLHTANFVYAWSEEHGDHFVLIDGIGCKNLIPFNRLSPLVNRYSKRRRIQRFMNRVDNMLAASRGGRPIAATGRQVADCRVVPGLADPSGPARNAKLSCD